MTCPSSAESPAGEPSPEVPSSYGQILRSSSIIGGATGINHVVGLIRTKIVAVLLGPSGVGLVGMYVQLSGTIGVLAGLGIGSSGVRQIAEAHGSGDPMRMAGTVKTLRRLSWVTGFLGWILAASLALPLSKWIFEDASHAWAIALLGATVLFSAISSGQTALLEGVRRIGDLARIQVVTTLLNTVAAIALYAWLHDRGIVPVLMVTAAIQWVVSWSFARQVQPTPVSLSAAETLKFGKELVSLGLVFMWSGLLSSVVLLSIRALIIRELGLDANGLYQAAWGISGMFAGFILGAMAADFYPRLTAAASDHEAVNRLVNEQTEIGILLALPGLMGTLAFAPWLMHLLYSAKFIPGADLLPWFVLGVFGQVVSWPMGFVVIAKNQKSWFLATTTLASLLHLGFTYGFLKAMGLIGAAIAMPVLYVFYTLLVVVVSRHLTGFRWNHDAARLLLASGLIVVCGFTAARSLPVGAGLVVGGILVIASAIFSLRGLARRLGREHRMIQMATRAPGAKWLLGW